MTWVVGQRVALNNVDIVVIDSVSPSGRAKIGDRIFNPDGKERGRPGWAAPVWILELTPEIEARVAPIARMKAARVALRNALGQAESLYRLGSNARGYAIVDDAAAAQMEATAAAINAVLGAKEGETT